MSFSIPYLFTLYLRLENQTSALVFLKFSGNVRTTNLRPLVFLFFCLFIFFRMFYRKLPVFFAVNSPKKSAVEKCRQEIVWVCPGVWKPSAKSEKVRSAKKRTTTTTAKVLISDTRFLKIWILPFRAICLLFELFGFEFSWARIRWTFWMNYHA